MNPLAWAAVVTSGFVGSAEFGSYAFVHPVLRRLPSVERIVVEQGLLRTFGRVMPIGMTLTPVMAIWYAVSATSTPNSLARWAGAGAVSLALVSTLMVNVRINVATGRWDPQAPPPDWEATRRRWEFFQGIRSWLLLAGFLCLAWAAGG